MSEALQSTEDAIALGLALRGDALRIERLREIGSRHAERSAFHAQAGNLESAMRCAFSMQFYREALEAATDTGGVSELLARRAAAAVAKHQVSIIGPTEAAA